MYRPSEMDAALNFIRSNFGDKIDMDSLEIKIVDSPAYALAHVDISFDWDGNTGSERKIFDISYHENLMRAIQDTVEQMMRNEPVRSSPPEFDFATNGCCG